MRFTIILSLLISFAGAIDYSNMFITAEPYNPYSSLNTDEKVKKEYKERLAKKKNPTDYQKKSLNYQVQLGFESESGYDNSGYGLIGSVVKDMPKLYSKIPTLFVQADLLYTLNEISTTAGVKKDYLAVSGFGGYNYIYDPKTTFYGKLGGSFITNSSSFSFTYGVGVKRAMSQKEYTLVANFLQMGSLTIFSIGIESSF